MEYWIMITCGGLLVLIALLVVAIRVVKRKSRTSSYQPPRQAPQQPFRISPTRPYEDDNKGRRKRMAGDYGYSDGSGGFVEDDDWDPSG